VVTGRAERAEVTAVRARVAGPCTRGDRQQVRAVSTCKVVWSIPNRPAIMASRS